MASTPTIHEIARVIWDIMRKKDIQNISAKEIRRLCEQKLNIDLTSRKQEINQLIMKMYQEFKIEKNSSVSEDSDHSGEGSSDKNSSSSDSESDSTVNNNYKNTPLKKRLLMSAMPKKSENPKKKRKTNTDGQCNAVTSSSSANKLHSSSDRSSSERSVESTPQASTSRKNKRKNIPVKRKTVPAKTFPTVTDVSPSKLKVISAKPSTSGVKKEKNTMQELSDEALARKLQAEEWNFRASTIKKLPKDVPKKDGQSKPKRAGTSMYSRTCVLSPELAEVLQTNEMPRHDVVKRMWQIFKERNLFDPKNKQYGICDAQLLKIFGVHRVRLFGMMKYLKHHVKDKK